MGCWLGTTGMRASFVPVLVMTVLCFSASRWLRCTQHSSLRLIVAVNGQISSAKENASAVLKKYFPQTQQCSSDWRHRYAQLHKAVVVGAAPPRYLVSVAVEKGTADRITGSYRVERTSTTYHNSRTFSHTVWSLCRISNTILPGSAFKTSSHNGHI